jgi:hypothetical protein
VSAKKILKGQPLKIKVFWWAVTLTLILFSLPFLGIALINPFWFRQGFFNWVEENLYSLTRMRDNFFKPILKKYQLFDTIKAV